MTRIIYDSETIQQPDTLTEHLRNIAKRKTPAKAEASRRNGALGGRPKGQSNRCPKCGGGWTSNLHKACK